MTPDRKREIQLVGETSRDAAARCAIRELLDRVVDLEAALSIHRRDTSEREIVEPYVRERAVCTCGWRGPWALALDGAPEPSIDLHLEDVARRALGGERSTYDRSEPMASWQPEKLKRKWSSPRSGWRAMAAGCLLWAGLVVWILVAAWGISQLAEWIARNFLI